MRATLQAYFENLRLRRALSKIAALEKLDLYREGYEPILDVAIKIAKKALK
jgi:hypothetical protein